MKHLLCIVSMVLMGLSGVHAENSNLSFRFGAKGGISYTDVKMSGGFSHDNTQRTHWGAFAEITNKNIFNFFLRGGINYTKRGFKYQNQITENRYIEVPIQLGYKLPLVRNISVYGVAGPSAYFRTYGNGYIKGFPSERWNVKKVGAGLDLGAGVELFNLFQLECQYQYGLTPDYKSANNTARNQSLLLSLGVVF